MSLINWFIMDKSCFKLIFVFITKSLWTLLCLTVIILSNNYISRQITHRNVNENDKLINYLHLINLHLDNINSFFCYSIIKWCQEDEQLCLTSNSLSFQTSYWNINHNIDGHTLLYFYLNHINQHTKHQQY